MFCGDSPNDAPMFALLPYGCGVANIVDFVGPMAAEPAYVAASRGSEGFIEIADRILAARKGSGIKAAPADEVSANGIRHGDQCPQVLCEISKSSTAST